MNALLGPTRPDLMGIILNTRYHRFESPSGISGLAKEIGNDRLDLLAVSASNPGHGQFRKFIEQAKRKYRTICVWYVDNVFLKAALARYSFTPETEADGIDGVVLHGMRWDSISNP